MSQRNRLLVWLTGVLILLGTAYASLPWLLVAILKQNLSARGLTDIRLSVESLGWHGLRLRTVAFTAMAGKQRLQCEIPEIQIEYQLTDLFAGRVTRIQVPATVVHALPAADQRPALTADPTIPLAVLLSGQWLSQLPLQELVLEQFNLDGQTSTKERYTLQMNGNLRDAQLQLNGELKLASALHKPIVASFFARHTGEARLFFSPAGAAAQPLLALTVNPIGNTREPLQMSGTLDARLKTLMPLLTPWLQILDQVSDVEGELSSHWQAQIQDATWQITGETVVQGLTGRWRAQALPRGEVVTTFDINPQQATLNTTLRTGEQAVALEVKGRHEFANGKGRADFRLQPVKFSTSGFVLSRLLQEWPYPIDITAGTVAAHGEASWQKTLELHATIQLDNVGGYYNKLTFAGIKGEMSVTNGAGIHTTEDAKLHVDVFDVGFPVEKIDLIFALAAQSKSQIPIVHIRKFDAALLGGKLRTDSFELDFERDKNAFVLQLEGIGLGDIMKLEQQEELQGTGRLDGQIPVEISRDGIIVTKGQLSARTPGGHIRYTPTAKVAALAKSNTSVNLVVEALSNYQYHLMEITTDYKPEGDLLLQVRLQGKNPDWQAGQPIHLNLNLQENIPTLLRSLQLSEELSEQVRKRYEKKK